MSHNQSHPGYRELVHRLNRFPQGAPPSNLLYRILTVLMNQKEAGLLSLLPLRPFTPSKAAGIWKMSMTEAEKVLDSLADRGLMLDIRQEEEVYYVLPPPMAGFFEFSLMRVRSDLDQKSLSRLLYRYINTDDSFITSLFAGGETQMGRVFVSEPAIPSEYDAQVLDYERASRVIATADAIAVGTCYCRHKMAHLGKACATPMETCMTLNVAAASVIRHGHARRIDAAEGLDILQEAWSRGLIQCGDNVREGVNFICNCCGCCCEGLVAARRLAIPHALYTTNFIAGVSQETCSGCGACSEQCPVSAISMTGGDHGASKAAVIEDLCLGCGLCTRSCRQKAVRLSHREKRVLTPVNTAHRIVLMALERGKLPELIFDNQALSSHRTMAAILGVILRLPPVKRVLASRQLKSRYLDRLFSKIEVTAFST